MDDIRIINWQTYGETVIHPVALGFTLLMGMLVVTLPRRLALVPAIATACFITDMQRLVIGDLDFNMMRILLLFGWARLLLQGELFPLRLNPIDNAVLFFVSTRLIMYTLLWGSFGALAYQLGEAFDAFGMYFLCRFLLLDFEDLASTFTAIALICIPLALSMLIEQAGGRNMFAVFGGVPEFSVVREGKLRAQGAFSHPIMAGTFGGTMVPLLAALWWVRHNGKKMAVFGTFAAIIIVWTSASSGPVLALLFGLAGLLAWGWRKHLPFIRWIGICTLVALHLCMKDPVWALAYRMNVVGGSTGYHRYELIDAAINRFHEWWLMGIKTTAYWGYGLQDVTNQYIQAGVDGGVLPLMLFLLLIARCFRGLGRARIALRDQPEARIFVWPLSASLFATTMSFLSVSYFGQMIHIWYLQLAFTSVACDLSLRLPAGSALRLLEAHSPHWNWNKRGVPFWPAARNGFLR